MTDDRTDQEDGTEAVQQMAQAFQQIAEQGGQQEPDQSQDEDPPDEAYAGYQAGEATQGWLADLGKNLSLFGSKLIPKSQDVWRGLLKVSYKNIYKSSDDVDAIAHVNVGGEIRHVPVTFNYEKSRYETLDGEEYWNAQSEADNLYRVGSVPAVWATSEANELGSHVQADVAEALDLGEGQALYQSAVVNHVEVDTGVTGQAVADGGQPTREWQSQITVEDPGLLEDQLVDLTADGDADGRVVSMEKYYETYPSTATPEEMKAQEERGRLAEMDPDRNDVVKLLLICLGIVAVAVLGPEIVNALLGGGGGGGGGGVLPGLVAPLVGVS